MEMKTSEVLGTSLNDEDDEMTASQLHDTYLQNHPNSEDNFSDLNQNSTSDILEKTSKTEAISCCETLTSMTASQLHDAYLQTEEESIHAEEKGADGDDTKSVSDLMTASQLHKSHMQEENQSSRSLFPNGKDSLPLVDKKIGLEDNITADCLVSETIENASCDTSKSNSLSISDSSATRDTNSGNSQVPPIQSIDRIDVIDTNTQLRTSHDSRTTINVECKTETLPNSDLTTLPSKESSHDLMTVSQLNHEHDQNEAERSQDCDVQVKGNPRKHSCNQTTSDKHDRGRSSVQSVNFDGMTISQLYDATNDVGLKKSLVKADETSVTDYKDDLCNDANHLGDETADYEDIKDIKAEHGAHSDSFDGHHNDRYHSNRADTAGGSHDEEEETHVTAKRPGGINEVDDDGDSVTTVLDTSAVYEQHKERRLGNHRDQHKDRGQASHTDSHTASHTASHSDSNTPSHTESERQTSLRSPHDPHSDLEETGGVFKGVSAYCSTSSSHKSLAEAQVGLSGEPTSPACPPETDITDTTDMLCISTNPLQTLDSLRTRKNQNDVVIQGDFNAFNLVGAESHNLACDNDRFGYPERGTRLKYNFSHDDLIQDKNNGCYGGCYDEESHIPTRNRSTTDTELTSRSQGLSVSRDDLTSYQHDGHNLVRSDLNSEKSGHKLGNAHYPNTTVINHEPQTGISGSIDNLSIDFSNIGLNTLKRLKTKNGDHAKLLRMYNQIGLEDTQEDNSKDKREDKSEYKQEDKGEISTGTSLNQSYRTGINLSYDSNLNSTSDTTTDLSNNISDSGYGTIKRNGSTSPSVKLRRQKSDPGRKILNGSPLLRVKGIIIDDASSNDSDSPRSEDSEDEDDDAGIYADSYRMSRWLYLGESDLSFLSDVGSGISRSGSSSPSMAGTTSSGTCDSLSDLLDEGQDVVSLELQEGRLKEVMGSQELLGQGETKKRNHRRSESISTTASEVEFRLKYKTKTRRVVQRKSSMQLYQRISEKYLDEGRIVTIEKLDEDASFGFHIKDNQPVIVSTIEEGSPAQRGGLQVGDVLIAVNEVNVLEASHQEVVKLMAADTDRVKLRVVADRLPADAPLCCGYLTKQGGSGILKNWRRRWFALKQDHCLYYYKNEEDKDPLGAILLSNYTITKATEINRKFVFKASKYGQRTYYFQAENEEDMNGWASAMASAANVTNKKDTWLDVSSHNVGLPALAIKHPDCHGHLTKMGNRHKTWKRRYCVLKDACLYYYLDVSSSTAQGVAHLHGYTVEDHLPFNKKFGFMVVPPDKNLRTFYFSADNETDKKRWMEALQKSIGRWVRADEA